MNWFKRHLNWTFVLVGTGINIILFGIFMPFLINVEGDSLFYSPIATIYGILYYVAPMILGGWVLKQKGRSLWQLLWWFTGFGGIAILVLENKSEEWIQGTEMFNKLHDDLVSDSEKQDIRAELIKRGVLKSKEAK